MKQIYHYLSTKVLNKVKDYVFIILSLSLSLSLSLPTATQLLQSATQSRDLLRVSSSSKVDHDLCPHPLGLSWGEFCVCCVEAHSMLSQHRNRASRERYAYCACGYDILGLEFGVNYMYIHMLPWLWE